MNNDADLIVSALERVSCSISSTTSAMPPFDHYRAKMELRTALFLQLMQEDVRCGATLATYAALPAGAPAPDVVTDAATKAVALSEEVSHILYR